MLLFNAVYFKGKWKQKFDKETTQDRIFYISGFTKAFVPTMSVTGNFIYGELPEINASFIELPYKVIFKL